MRTAPLPPIAALRETSKIFAALIVAFIFKEDLGKYRIFATGIVSIGILILNGNIP